MTADIMPEGWNGGLNGIFPDGCTCEADDCFEHECPVCKVLDPEAWCPKDPEWDEVDW
jgi:hypothetical protein